MGYAGYVPAKLPPSKPSAVQAALWGIQNPATLEVMVKLIKNMAVSPSEEKYRRVKLSNPKIQTLIVEEKGALAALREMGWKEDTEDADLLVVPKGLNFSMNEVRMIQDAEERLKKSSRVTKRSASAAKLPVSKEQAEIKKQMEADRLERASRAA